MSSTPGVDAARKQLRSMYSLGFIDRFSRNALPIFLVLWPPRYFSSILATMSGSHHAPFSAITYRRLGWRSNTPDQSSTHSGRAAHQYASVA